MLLGEIAEATVLVRRNALEAQRMERRTWMRSEVGPISRDERGNLINVL